MHKSNIADLEKATGNYGLQVEGDALAPTIRHGQYMVVVPACNLASTRFTPGHIILAAIREQSVSIAATENLCLMRFNGDGDLVDAHGKYVPAGEWRALGLVTSVMTVLVE